ncbi:MAG: hypothetical protein ACFB9N_03815 [Geitlerinemataceae cyanobacterium]
MPVTTIPKIQLLPGAISDMMVSSNKRGYLTVADRYGLMAATLDETLDESERRCINRVVRSVSRGRLRVSDILS